MVGSEGDIVKQRLRKLASIAAITPIENLWLRSANEGTTWIHKSILPSCSSIYLHLPAVNFRLGCPINGNNGKVTLLLTPVSIWAGGENTGMVQVVVEQFELPRVPSAAPGTREHSVQEPIPELRK